MMKKSLSTLLIIAALSVACSKTADLEPAVSLFAPQPEIYEETAIFRLASMAVDTSYAQHFPVTFGGTAERGVDYTVSGDEFILGGVNPVDSIVVTTLKFGTDRTLTLSLTVADGIGEGKYLTSEYTLQDKLAYISFPTGHAMITDSLDIGFSTCDRKGKIKVLGKDAAVTLSIDTEKSTAVEGEDFVFADSSHYTIAKGASNGSLKLKALKPKPSEGRDLIVLNLGFDEKYGAGAEQQMTISLMDTLWNCLNGKWEIDTLVTDSTYMRKYWNESYTGLDLMPRFNPNDVVEFDLGTGSFSPRFYSGFKHYFIGKSVMEKGKALDLDLGNGESASVQTFLLDKTNRDFSQDFTSEDTESYIGLRLIDGEDTDTLDFYVIDYVSRSFLPELAAEEKYAPEKPVAASPGLFLNLTFTN